MPLDAILDRRLLIISGKGGVGKTTISAAIAILAARHDLDVLVAEVEGSGSLSSIFGAEPLTTTPTELAPGVHGMNISPEEALREYFEVQFHLRRIAKPVLASQLVYYVTHAAPGLHDLLTLGKVWYAATRKREFDLIVFDTPAAGHAVSMLRSPEGFLHAVPIGRLAGHVRQVFDFLRDPEQVAIHLVTIGEEMPVNETIETQRLLEERVGMNVGITYFNMAYPTVADDPDLARRFETLGGPEDLVAEAAASGGSLSKPRARALWETAEFYRCRRALQQEHRARLEEAVAHTAPIVDLPFLFRDRFGMKELEMLADAIEERLENPSSRSGAAAGRRAG
ncbi:MAG: ArsA family ATPase [Actinomycetota bacterium]